MLFALLAQTHDMQVDGLLYDGDRLFAYRRPLITPTCMQCSTKGWSSDKHQKYLGLLTSRLDDGQNRL
jgi:hypothetical protein